jgi:sirohydrochlorin ferrochelatase
MADPETMTMLGDEDLGLILEGKGRKLANGEKDREEVVRELAELLGEETVVINREDERVKPDGRVSFGRGNAGQTGTALFVTDGDSDD